MITVHLQDEDSLAHCLLRREDSSFLACDSQFAAWLGSSLPLEAPLKFERLLPGWDDLLGELDSLVSPFLSTETVVVCSNGHHLKVSLNVTVLNGVAGELVLLAFFPVQDSGSQDALTGLSDRRELSRRYKRLQVDPSVGAYALLFMDLDDFKAINDRLGHAIGDQVLKKLAARWQNCLREADLLVRYGGDEFVVLLANLEQPEAVEAVVSRLKEVAAEPLTIGSHRLLVTASIGVSLVKDVSCTDLGEWIALADQAMYMAKRKDS